VALLFWFCGFVVVGVFVVGSFEPFESHIDDFDARGGSDIFIVGDNGQGLESAREGLPQRGGEAEYLPLFFSFWAYEGDMGHGDGENRDGRGRKGPEQLVLGEGFPAEWVACAQQFPEVAAGYRGDEGVGMG